MKLFIVHSHYRPGGVRRVIELGAPEIVAALRPSPTEVVLMGGEAPDARWLKHFSDDFDDVRVTCAMTPALGYVSEQRGQAAGIAERIRTHLRRCFAGLNRDNAVIWVHNPGLGRNLMVAAELGRIAAEQDLRMIFHHHDWWFDNRWARWPEMQRSGFRTLASVAGAILPTCPIVRHAAINQADARVLRRQFGACASWIPNPVTPDHLPSGHQVRRARRWLKNQLGDDGPVWLVPCRLLRRKDLAEALLLTRWLRPEAWLVTTGAMSSADEREYADALQHAIQRHGWRMRLSVLANGEFTKPSVPELLGASEAILLTSLQEGFGLPNLEAAAAQRPLITRRVPAIAPDLARFGFSFPQSYDEVQVDLGLFDAERERRRQSQRWRIWRNQLPRACRSLADQPPLLANESVPRSVAFSRLTFTAQLEVLAHPPEESWKLCSRLNPFLTAWRRRAASGTLMASRWPRGAAKWLSGQAYGKRIMELIAADPRTSIDSEASARAQDEFIRLKLDGKNQYPLLWAGEP